MRPRLHLLISRYGDAACQCAVLDGRMGHKAVSANQQIQLRGMPVYRSGSNNDTCFLNSGSAQVFEAGNYVGMPPAKRQLAKQRESYLARCYPAVGSCVGTPYHGPRSSARP